MSVIADNAKDDENAAVIKERLDFKIHGFGVMRAKRHPPYVFGIRGVSCLIHKIRYVEMHWWRIGGPCGAWLIKLKKPVLIATTNCAQSFRLDGDIARTCQLPNPDALPCGRCNSEGATFGKSGPSKKEGLTRQQAHVKLGCVVKGY